MSSTTSILSLNIRYLRKKAKMSQDELAQKLGIKRSNIAAYESKNVEPRLRIVLEMARLFDVSVKTLIATQLGDDVNAPSFADSNSPRKSSGPEAIGENVAEVNQFVEKSMKIRKVLEGFKSFYLFKKSNIDMTQPGNEKLTFDIDNFIQLMEHLLAYNETVIKAISIKVHSQRESA